MSVVASRFYKTSKPQRCFLSVFFSFTYAKPKIHFFQKTEKWIWLNINLAVCARDTLSQMRICVRARLDMDPVFQPPNVKPNHSPTGYYDNLANGPVQTMNWIVSDSEVSFDKKIRSRLGPCAKLR